MNKQLKNQAYRRHSPWQDEIHHLCDYGDCIGCQWRNVHSFCGWRGRRLLLPPAGIDQPLLDAFTKEPVSRPTCYFWTRGWWSAFGLKASIRLPTSRSQSTLPDWSKQRRAGSHSLCSTIRSSSSTFLPLCETWNANGSD